jgi:hypothetical protein
MAADPGRIGFIVAAIFVLGWFALGTILNIRRGNRLLRWLENGLPNVGPRTTLRWIGSSGVELKVRDALEPLKSAEVFILLEPRDLPLLWWLFRMRGRRDLLILRAELRRAPPPFELEALDRRAWSTRGLERRLTRDRWSPLAVPTGSALAAYGRGGGNGASELVPLATLPDLPLVRLAVRSGAPNLEVQWHLTDVGAVESRRVFDALYQLARRL